MGGKAVSMTIDGIDVTAHAVRFRLTNIVAAVLLVPVIALCVRRWRTLLLRGQILWALGSGALVWLIVTVIEPYLIGERWLTGPIDTPWWPVAGTILIGTVVQAIYAWAGSGNKADNPAPVPAGDGD
jgi:hypothetical protein